MKLWILIALGWLDKAIALLPRLDARLCAGMPRSRLTAHLDRVGLRHKTSVLLVNRYVCELGPLSRYWFVTVM